VFSKGFADEIDLMIRERMGRFMSSQGIHQLIRFVSVHPAILARFEKRSGSDLLEFIQFTVSQSLLKKGIAYIFKIERRYLAHKYGRMIF